jgi:hypothetical protein
MSDDKYVFPGMPSNITFNTTLEGVIDDLLTITFTDWMRENAPDKMVDVFNGKTKVMMAFGYEGIECAYMVGELFNIEDGSSENITDGNAYCIGFGVEYWDEEVPIWGFMLYDEIYAKIDVDPYLKCFDDDIDPCKGTDYCNATVAVSGVSPCECIPRIKKCPQPDASEG